MDKDCVAGAAKQAKGALKDATGKINGNDRLQVEGRIDKAVGHAQNTVGQAKDAVRAAAVLAAAPDES